MNDCPYSFASFNCKNVKRSLDAVRELCHACDLIALQETWLLPDDIPYLCSIDRDFGYTGTSAVDTSAGILRGRPHGGVALLWNYEVFPQVSVLQCNNARVCAIKIITSDRPIIVVSVYMPTNVSANLPEFTDCLGTVSAIINEYGVESVFILGDFNADPSELFFNELSDFCEEQKWSCIDVDMLGVQSGTYTFLSDVYGTCSWLDHCIVTQAVRRTVCNVYVKYDTTWSDHFPLIVQCNLNLLIPKSDSDVNTNKDIIWGERDEAQVVVYVRECHSRLSCIDFPVEFSQCADGYCGDPGHRRILDRLYSDIVAALRDAAVVSDRGTRAGSGRKGSRWVGWSEHVRGAHREARSRFLEWVMCGRPRTGCVYDDMNKSRKVFNSRLKWCQDHQDQVRMDAIAEKHKSGDFRSFWQCTNNINSRPGRPVSVGGVSGSKGIADLFGSHFRVQSPLGQGVGVPTAEMLSGLVGTRFKAKDVAAVIKTMNKGKSPGHDGLSIEHLQHAGPHISRVLALFYSLCVSHSYLPADLMKTDVVPVVKNKTGDVADLNNYRPISLATIVAKVFDGLLNTQLDKYLLLHDNQFGFRPKLSTEAAILSLKHVVRYYTDRKTPVYACFLDLSRAFDLVSYDILWQKLESIGLPPELLNIFKYWYRYQINSVRWAGVMSEPYRLECGVRQGGLTSPALFNLYVNALIVGLSSQHVGCHVDGVCVNNLSYADDMVLLSASVCGLRKLMRTCEEYASSHGLKYNAGKSKYMVFGAIVNSVPPVYINNAPLEKVKQFKYLGHIVTVDLKDDADIERERRALSVRGNMIARRFVRCSREVKITLFRAYCTSLYTCSLWTKYTRTAYSALRVQFNNAFRAVLGLPRRCSASGMFAEARTDCFHATMRKRCASLMRRVRGSANTVLAMIANRLDCPYIQKCSSRHIVTII